ncbi:MAG: ATP-binding protein [Termitinemataceae bacterium]|nr:MAG: ATP-binding protein [Termitinemataceae bacterium]
MGYAVEFFKRHMEYTFRKINSEYAAILITGQRQTGKTTMLQNIAIEEGKNREYVCLDNVGDRSLAQNDPEMFFKIHKPPVLIDEVQYAPQLFSYIKIQVDTYHRPGDFWLTGSQLYRLMRGVEESLSGRIALLRLLPFSQAELCGAKSAPFLPDIEILNEKQNSIPIMKDTANDIFKLIYKGSMPALASGQYSNREVYYSSYINTYLLRDVIELAGAVDSLKFYNFLTATAARTAQLINCYSIAEESGIDQSTAKKWLNILETLGIIFYLHPYSNNTLKRTIKKPKLYFYDTGLPCYLTKWSSPDTIQNGASGGAFLENFVVSEIAKGYHNAGLEPYLYYYRNRDDKEIDIIIERDGLLYPLEVKKTNAPHPTLSRVFKVLPNRGLGAIICLADRLGALDRDTLVVPARLV